MLKDELEILLNDLYSDSRSKSCHARDKLCGIAYDIMIDCFRIYNKFELSEHLHPITFGHAIDGDCEFESYNETEQKLQMTFEANWAYGGHSEGYAYFPIGLFIHYDKERLAKKCKQLQLSDIKESIKKSQKTIDRLTLKYEKILSDNI